MIENNNAEKKLDLIQDGLQVKNNFIDKETLSKLKDECNSLFEHTQLLGPGYSIRLHKYVSEIPQPTAKLTAINLLEVAIDISKEIEALGYKDYKFAHVALYNEEKNPKELVWHSDMRNGGLIRAQICIQGGDLNSGAFKYLKGTHKTANGEFYPPKNYLEKNKDKLVICNQPNGSLFLINTLGFHSKCVCNERRISLMFDFLPQQYLLDNPNDCASDMLLSSSRLTDKVIENIELFRSGVTVFTKSANTPDYYKFHKPFSGSNLKEIFNVLKIIVKSKINKK
jgi:hypothetical protein